MCALVTGVQTCALPIFPDPEEFLDHPGAAGDACGGVFRVPARAARFRSVDHKGFDVPADQELQTLGLQQLYALTNVARPRRAEIGRASCREECVSTGRSRWSP